MDEAAIIDYVGGLPGVVTFTASEENDAPASAWGDTFFFYDPEGKLAENQRLPFATVVIHDYAGWDTESRLDRDGIFRVNLAVGRSSFEGLLGHSPKEHAAHHERVRLRGHRRTAPTSDLRLPGLGLDPQSRRAHQCAATGTS